MPQRTINTPREETHQRIADALEDMVDKMVDTSSASNIDYDNTQSGLSANKVQGAVDELASEKADKSTTLAGYGITDAYTKAEVYTQSEVNNIVSTLETNIDWKEAVNTYADIATTYPNPQDGWTVNVKDTDYTYRYNGSEWVAISANAIPEATTSVKGLMTPTQVSKLNGIETGAQVNTVTSVAGKTGAVTLTKSDVGLGNVDNTSDLNKPISTAAQTALNSKVDKVAGKGLSTNDYTNEEKQKNADNASAIEDIQEDISTSQTATGNPITIEASESNLVECVAEVEAVQDLHGYGHPWVGGAGKNKLPMTVEGIKSANTSGTWSGNTYMLNGVTFEVLTDSADNVEGIKVNGTANAVTYFDLVQLFNSTEYAGMIANFSRAVSGTWIRISASDRVAIQEIYGGDTVIVNNGNNLKLAIRVDYNKSPNTIIQPMIRLSTETDSSFAPYTNICPISGRSEVAIQRDGKNLFNIEQWLSTYSVSYVKDNNTYTFNTELSLFNNYYEFNKPINIILSSIREGGTATNVGFLFYDENDNELTSRILSGTINNAKKFRLDFSSSGSLTLKDPMIRLATVADATFEPYTGVSHSIALGSTIYGGELDVTRGTLTVTHGEVDLGDLSWIYAYDAFRSDSINSLIARPINDNTVPNVLTPLYKPRAWNDSTDMGVFVVSQSSSYPMYLTITDSRYTDPNAFKSAMSGVQLVYELAEPFTIDLTPQQIRLLKGTNNISCNTGDLSIKYYPDNVLGQLKGDIEDEYDEKLSDLSNIEDTLNNKVDKAVVISEAIDLYTLTESGFYYIANVDQCTHKPNAYSALGSGTMIVARAGNRAMQILKAGNLLFETTIINLDTTPSATSWYRIPLQLRKQYDVTTDSNGIATLMTNFASNSVIPIHVFDTSGDIAIPYLNYNRNEVLCKFINPATMAPRSNASVLGDLIYQAYD